MRFLGANAQANRECRLRGVTRLEHLSLGRRTTSPVSCRSLQRILAGHGLTLRRLLDQVRFERACELLEDDSARLVDIALDLGYSDQAHFTRAFRRWTGETPGAYRRRRRLH